MSEPDIVEALRSVPLFSHLTDDRLQRVAGLGEIVRHPAGHVIIQEGRPAQGFHLLLQGEVDVLIGGRARRSLGPGSFFGELALIDEGERSASVIASTPITAVAIVGSEFRGLLHQDPELSYQILVYLARLVRDAERQGEPDSPPH